MPIHFSKMHGTGNDFIVLDLRKGQQPPDAEFIKALGHRHTGIGFDQLLTIETSDRTPCIARYRIWNNDGSPAQQCGNGARCVAAWLIRNGTAKAPCFALDSPTGVVRVECLANGEFALAMGVPEFRPEHIPLHAERERSEYGASLQGARVEFGAVSMGNPHALIIVEDIAQAPVAELGPALQSSGLFPQGVNVGFAQIVSASQLLLRVYERGAGETLACGSGACAAVAILVRQNRIGRHAEVTLSGGTLAISWPADEAPVRMAGPATFVFEGEWMA